MQNKNTIYIVLIVVALSVTGFLIYKAVSGPSASVPTNLTQGSTNTTSIVNILPMGNKFDTSSIKKLNSQFNIFTYPQVSPDSVGVSTSNMIKTPIESNSKPGS